MKFWLSTLTIGALLLPSSDASAERDTLWSTDLEAVTEVPLSLGARMVIESPERVRVGISLGNSPGDYIKLINNVVVAAGAYDTQTAALIESSFDRSFVMRLDLGWRPLEDSGLYGQAGYRLISFGGVADGQAVIDVLGDISLNDGTSPSFYSYGVDASLHTLDLELGWIWTLVAGLRLRAGLGFVATLDANINVSPLYNIDLYKARIETTLTQTYIDYGFTPTVAVGLGYRFQ